MTDPTKLPARAGTAGRSPQYRSSIIAAAIVGMIAAASAQPASAAETIAYTYDAKGRLIKVVRSGSANNGETSDYTHDKADNRKRVNRTGAASP